MHVGKQQNNFGTASYQRRIRSALYLQTRCPEIPINQNVISAGVDQGRDNCAVHNNLYIADVTQGRGNRGRKGNRDKGK